MSAEAPSPADYAIVADLIRSTARIEATEAAVSGADAERLMASVHELPPLPFERTARIAFANRGRYFGAVESLLEAIDVRKFVLAAADFAAGAIRQPRYGRPLSADAKNRATRLLRRSTYEPVIDAARESYKVDSQTTSEDATEAIRRYAPYMLLSIAGAAAVGYVIETADDEAMGHNMHERTESVAKHSDALLRRIATEVIQGQSAVVNEPGGVDLVRKALTALQACANIGETKEELLKIVGPLVTVNTATIAEMRATTSAPLKEGRPIIIDLGSVDPVLTKSGLRLKPLMQESGFSNERVLDEAIAEALANGAVASHPDAMLPLVNWAYAQIRSRQSARILLHDLASGRLNYASLYLAVLQGESPILKLAARDAAERREAAVRLGAEAAARLAGEQAAEEARLQDLGWLSVKLNLDPNDEVDVEFLPSATGTRSSRLQPEATQQREARERIARVEPHRLLTLIRLQEIYPGSVLRFRTLKNKKGDTDALPRQRQQSDGNETPVDPMKVDGHLVLVLPNGRAVGESLQPGNATVVFRPETWEGVEPRVTWKDAFGFDKQSVKDFATVRIQHPDKRDLATDYRGTVDSYVLLVLEDLEYPLQPGQTLPDLDMMRNLRRAMGGKAVVATPR